MTAPDPIRIVFLDRGTLSPDIRLKSFSFPHELVVHDQTSPGDVAARIEAADVVITNKVPIRRDVVADAGNLKMVAVAATGTDVIDIVACGERGVLVSNIREYATSTVPEHTFALILALRRSLLPYHRSIARGRWQEVGQFCYFDYPIHNLAGSTLGIIGDGVLGRAVGDLGRAFGMKVLYATYKGVSGMGPLYTDFDAVLETSDVITLHCPLLPSTRNMISTAEFERMGCRPLLINTARGGLVDEAALVEAIRTNRIAGAGFDVLTAEPPGPDHPFLQLVDAPNFILTPHVAWASQEAVQGLADQLVSNIEAFVRGEPKNVVQPTA